MSTRSASAIRFDPELHERLTDASRQHGFSVNWLVNKAVADFLDRLLPPEQVVWTRQDGDDG